MCCCAFPFPKCKNIQLLQSGCSPLIRILTPTVIISKHTSSLHKTAPILLRIIAFIATGLDAVVCLEDFSPCPVHLAWQWIDYRLRYCYYAFYSNNQRGILSLNFHKQRTKLEYLTGKQKIIIQNSTSKCISRKTGSWESPVHSLFVFLLEGSKTGGLLCSKLFPLASCFFTRLLYNEKNGQIYWVLLPQEIVEILPNTKKVEQYGGWQTYYLAFLEQLLLNYLGALPAIISQDPGIHVWGSAWCMLFTYPQRSAMNMMKFF